jgi:hypothetical protein
MKVFEILNGKFAKEGVKEGDGASLEMLNEIRRFENRFINEEPKNGRIMVLMSTHLESWDPKTEGGRLAIFKNLDQKLITYVGINFPEITTGVGGVIPTIHAGYLMADFLITGSQRSESGSKTINSYKLHFFDGPEGTSMVTVPVPAVYGTAPAVVPADFMGYVRSLRTKLMENPNMTDDILKDLMLYGTDVTFDPTTYVAVYSVHPFPGYMHFHVSTKNVKTHNIYIRKAGTTTWDAPIRFDGANFDVHRVPTTSPENLEVMLKGIINNIETAMLSVIRPVTYNAAF